MLMVAGITIGVTSSAHAVVIDFQNSVQSVPFGSTVSMELRYSSLPDYLSPASFDIEVGFNSTILGFSGVTFGDPVNGDQLNPDGLAYQEVLGPYDLATPGFSAVNLVETASSLPAVQLGEFLLATISFSTIAAGSADLWINVNALYDPAGAPLDPIYAGIGRIIVTSQPPTSVPEPGTLLLAAAGFLGLLSSSRLFKRS
jgi:hypothetical protein